MPRKMVINRTVKLNRVTGSGEAFVRISKNKIKSVPVLFDVYSTYPMPRVEISARVRFKELIKSQLRTAVFAKKADDEELISKAVETVGNFEILDFTIKEMKISDPRELRIIFDIEKYLSNRIETQHFIRAKFVDEINKLKGE